MKLLLVVVVIALTTTSAARADIFVFDALTLMTSLEQLPDAPGGSLLDNVFTEAGFSSSCGIGGCRLQIAPKDPDFTIEDPTNNSASFLDTALNPPVATDQFGQDAVPADVCLPNPCYVLNLYIEVFTGDNTGIPITGGLQIVPFTVTWVNGPESYTDTFEIEASTAGVPVIPEPAHLGVELLCVGIGILVVRKRRPT
jgi:hypothetical protein